MTESERLPFEKTEVPPSETQAPPIEKRNLPTPIEAKEGGALIGGTFEQQYRLAKAYHASGLMPAALNSPEKVLVVLQMCFELELKPMTSVGKICVINGTASIFGDLPLALVRRSGQLKSFKEEFIYDEKQALVGARCTVWRKGDPESTIREFTVQDAKNAKLWLKTGREGKPTPWVLYPNRMLQMRTRSWALKDTFPDVLMGCSILEYDHNTVVEHVEQLAEGNSLVAELEDAYLSKEETNSESEINSGGK